MAAPRPQWFLVAGLSLLASLTACRREDVAQGQTLRVQLADSAAQPASGRLLLFAMPAAEARAAAKDGKVVSVDTSPFKPTQVSVAAMEVTQLAPGASVTVDTESLAFPAAFSKLKPGEYAMQAVLDVNHDYNYGGRGPGDWVSDVTMVKLGAGAAAPISLARALPGTSGPTWELPADAPKEVQDDAAAARPHAEPLDFPSPALTAFWGRPVHIRGWVLPPPDYAAHPGQRYPTVYYTHGFSGKLSRLIADVASMDERMRDGRMPPMIWVFLDESSATGTHEFADSVNNGPWGTALTTELIPELEKRYRMDARPSGRFLTGHSSGGWATLWLQVAYPKVFGGTWSTSPDPSDFTDFTGADLYAKDANVYRKPDGKPLPLVRDKGEVKATFEEFAKLERVLGPYGGQMSSFEWVFSPRGEDGRPVPLFDRDTGRVDPQVAAYWREHYDIAHRLRTQWPALKADLDGKVHVIVGDADTFYLDGSARKLKATLETLGAKTDVRFLPGRTHFDLYAEGDDRRALSSKIAWEMYAIARPDAPKPAKEQAPTDAVPVKR
ncbi:esterase family protein [Luteimonas sp. SX5]|uniref:Esterase family protein n=1 Tax=Luteimonas galliterrae TaxID=2940486 RepID=A0ABT0MI32_9GAMM|nr:alpha/beta hydrolase-fold protein [Luteimonas galliterrae]MCL1634529.1 esterase family protein [Luteimonas galliterrae]